MVHIEFVVFEWQEQEWAPADANSGPQGNDDVSFTQTPSNCYYCYYYYYYYYYYYSCCCCCCYYYCYYYYYYYYYPPPQYGLLLTGL